MKILKFKTNIEDQGMIRKLAPYLDKEELVSKWKVDPESEGNILSVSGEDITPDVVTRAVKEAGFEAEMVHILAIGGNDL